jgi:hypothetical protein
LTCCVILSATISAHEPQVVDTQEFIAVTDYDFSGDSTTVENKRRIVESYRLKATIYHAALAAQVHRATIYKYLESDPAFAQAMVDCHEDSVDVMETSVYERALGDSEQGIKGDSLLAMFWLKAHRPKFRDRVTVDLGQVQQEIQERMGQVQLLPPMITTPGDDQQS